MEVRRTVPVALDGDSDDAALLEDIFLWSAQCVVDHAFQVQGEYVTTSKTTLDDETYATCARKQTASTVVSFKSLATKRRKPAKVSSNAGSRTRRHQNQRSPVRISSTTNAL